MEAKLQEHVAFHLTGKRPGAGLDAVDDLDLRPALLAAYRDLTRLRYDFPVVLVRNSADQGCVQCLSGLVDGIVHEIAQGDDGERLTRHLLRLEQEIRVLVAAGSTGSLSTLWDTAAGRLAASGDAVLKDSLSRARAARKVDGEVVDCGKSMPARLLNHAWENVQEQKARRFRNNITRLIQKLSDILGADFARSDAGRSADRLKASVGAVYAEVFDFKMMSRVLGKASPKEALPKDRRQRIQELLSTLKSQRFFSLAGRGAEGANGTEPYSFVFTSCAGALKAFGERLPKAVELAKAIAVAGLEIEGQYDAAKHDAIFADYGVNGLDSESLAQFPDYLVQVNAANLSPAEQATLMEMLAAGLPVKVLVQTDDLLEKSPLAAGHLTCGVRARQFADLAIGLNEVYVLQSSGSNLFQFRDRILKGMAYHGPALFSVFSGASGNTGDLPPYLTAAAAMESRAFPAFTYDPSAGQDWASRFYLGANPQVELDWPVQRFVYEDEDHQRITENLAFTFVDFVACDQRYAKHFARVAQAKADGNLIPVSECLTRETKGLPGQVPCLLFVDDDNVLQKVIVDGRLIREARRCREMWHSLQELGGIHNSHAEQLLAREKKVWEELAQREGTVSEPEPAAPVAAPAAAAGTPAPAEPAPAPSPDEPYIESPRCTTCNECMQINNKMFAYDANKQAHIVNPDAGTYRQLVEAAENCQLSIIHPGKPRNPSEPGLEELIKRAEPFLSNGR